MTSHLIIFLAILISFIIAIAVLVYIMDCLSDLYERVEKLENEKKEKNKI
jgi:Na+-transporting methylmalonyl-CoA/oxaloacetate decarboxylase gamma subunit